jgi:hypothetical protein
VQSHPVAGPTEAEMEVAVAARRRSEQAKPTWRIASRCVKLRHLASSGGLVRLKLLMRHLDERLLLRAEVAIIKRQSCCRIGSEQCGSHPAKKGSCKRFSSIVVGAEQL